MGEPQQACTMWMALDAADERNGCLRYTLGSAARGLRHREYSGVMGFSQAIVDYGRVDELHEVAIEAQPGDLVVHHSLMIHRAGRNETSDRNRRAVGAICYGVSAKLDRVAYEKRQLEIR